MIGLLLSKVHSERLHTEYDNMLGQLVVGFLALRPILIVDADADADWFLASKFRARFEVRKNLTSQSWDCFMEGPEKM